MEVYKLALDILELQMKSKKKVLGIAYGSLLLILLKGAMAFLNSLKGAICKKVWETLMYTNLYTFVVKTFS